MKLDDNDFDEVTGYPKDKSYLEANLPDWLLEAIEQMVTAWEKYDNPNTEYTLWDCDYCLLQSQINIAEVEQIITPEQAWYLRKKYLRMERDEDI